MLPSPDHTCASCPPAHLCLLGRHGAAQQDVAVLLNLQHVMSSGQLSMEEGGPYSHTPQFSHCWVPRLSAPHATAQPTPCPSNRYLPKQARPGQAGGSAREPQTTLTRKTAISPSRPPTAIEPTASHIALPVACVRAVQAPAEQWLQRPVMGRNRRNHTCTHWQPHPTHRLPPSPGLPYLCPFAPYSPATTRPSTAPPSSIITALTALVNRLYTSRLRQGGTGSSVAE